MNVANISQFIVGIFPYQDYNETVYCLKNAIRNNNISRCTNISGFYLYEYFVLFALQVKFLAKHFIKTRLGTEHNFYENKV
jgi:hypothetical protein